MCEKMSEKNEDLSTLFLTEIFWGNLKKSFIENHPSFLENDLFYTFWYIIEICVEE